MRLFRRAVPALVPLVLIAAAPASAGSLSVTPEPGLWETRSKVLMNGRDMMADMAAMRGEIMERAMKDMSPEDRARMQAQMGGDGPSEVDRSCVTAKQAATAADPQAMLRELAKETSSCTIETTSVSSNAFDFHGTCKDPQGFNGTLEGRVSIPDSHRYTMKYTSRGKMSGAPDPVEMNAEFEGRWLASDCGDVEPDED